PRYARAKAPPPLPHERVAAEVLDSETALVEYVLGDKQSFAWVVFRGRVSSQAAAQAIAKLKAQSQPLYQKLFQPLEPYLVAARQLIIVPDGALAWLPFEALAGEPKHPAAVAPYLIERFAISYAPSASALAALRALRQNAAEAKGIVAFGDPVYVGSDSGE